MINQIEEIQFNAWPALRSMAYDGWILRLSEGVTRRSNSISPINKSHLDVHEKISYCEKLYRDAGLPVIFKLTRDVYPVDLDSILEQKGYAFDAETSVQVLNLSNIDPCSDDLVRITNDLDSSWLEHFIDHNGYDKNKLDQYGNIIRQIKPLTGFADLYVQGQHAGCGLGVVQDDFLGLFDIVIAPEYRQKGLGKELVNSIMAWGKDQGAKTAYLQVMTDNPAGLNLYRRLGFKEIYKYWYRVK